MEKIIITNDDKISELYLRHKFTKIAQDEAISRIDWIVDSVKGKTVLDIGCSQGISSILLAKRGYDVIGIDINPAAIEYANNEKLNLAQSEKENLAFHCIDLKSFIKITKIKFDTVILGEVIEHYAEPESIIHASTKLLKEKGRLLITTPIGLKPNDDHKSVFFPSNLINLFPECINVIHLDIENSFIKIIGEYSKNKENNDVNEKDILKLTEKGIIEVQTHLLAIIKRQNYVLKKITNANKKINTEKIENSIEEILNRTSQTISNQESILRISGSDSKNISLLKTSLISDLNSNFTKLEKLLEPIQRLNSGYKKLDFKFDENLDKKNNSLILIQSSIKNIKGEAEKIFSSLDEISNKITIHTKVEKNIVTTGIKEIKADYISLIKLMQINFHRVNEANSTNNNLISNKISVLSETIKKSIEQITNSHTSQLEDSRILFNNAKDQILESINTHHQKYISETQALSSDLNEIKNDIIEQITKLNINNISEFKASNTNYHKTQNDIIALTKKLSKNNVSIIQNEGKKNLLEYKNFITPHLTKLTETKIIDEDLTRSFSRSTAEFEKSKLRLKRILLKKKEELKTNILELERAKEKLISYKSLILDYQDKFHHAKSSFFSMEVKMIDWRKKSIFNKNESKERAKSIEYISKTKAIEIEHLNFKKNLEIKKLRVKLEKSSLQITNLKSLVKSNQDIFAHAKESYLNIEKRHTKLKKLLSNFKSDKEEELTEKDKITLKRHRDVIESKTYKISTSILDRLTGKQTYLSLPKNLYKIIKPPKQKQLT